MSQANNNSHHQNKKMANQSNESTQNNQVSKVRATPMIVERVNKIPLVNMAVSIGFAQYGKLKSSNVTVGDVMAKAESWACFFLEKLRPVLDKLEEPISRADKVACAAMDFVEDKIGTLKERAS